MTLFWVLSGLLVAIAWWFVVRPLLARGVDARLSRRGLNLAIYRDQVHELDADLQAGTLGAEHHDKARRELEARLLEDVEGGTEAPSAVRPSRVAAAVVALLIPLGAVSIYLLVGTPAALAPENIATAGAPHAADVKELEVAVERLAARLKENPEDTEGWVMLARSYKLFGRFPESAQAYAVAAAREPRDAQLLADYADVLAMARGRRLEGEPEMLIARALEADPRNLKALALAGSAAFEKKDYVGAVAHWERMLPLVQAGSEEARAVQASIGEARSLGQMGAAKPAPGVVPTSVRAAVTGTVTLAPELVAKVKPEDTVFIFARASEGPRMPLALVRKQVRELPVSFTLDDTTAMTPEMKLSNFAQIVVGARISRSGGATSQPGDLEGFSAPVVNTASGISVVIKNEIR